MATSLLALWPIIDSAPAQGPAATTAREPDAGDVVGAFMTVRRWVDDLDLPAPGASDARLTMRDAAGVCVLLRRAGRLWTGVDATGDELMARRATGRALSALWGDPAVAALPQEIREGIGRGLSLELEVAGPLVPLLGNTFNEIERQLVPGLDGVALRRGDRVSMLFPAQMLATNTAGRVARMLPSLAVGLGLNASGLEDLTHRFDVSMYRFRTTQLAQPGPRAAPEVLLRGDTIVEDAAVTTAVLRDTALGLAQRLADAVAPLDDPLGIMGTYRPVPDEYDPLIAPPVEQALAAWALALYSRMPGLDDMIAVRLSGTSELLLRELEQVAKGEVDPLEDLGACAAIVHAAIAHREYLVGGEPPILFREASRRVATAYRHDRGFVDAAPGQPLPPHTQALVAAGMARLLATGHVGLDAPLVRQAIDAAWASGPEHQHISLLPWIGWAEADVAAATGRPMAHVPELQRMRELLDASRITNGAPDLAGGFALAQGDRLLASAQTVRPACFLAWMVRDRRLTPPEQATIALGRILESCRFVVQLSVRDSALWSYRNPARARGGLRAASWDVDQPVAAQALGLVMLVETLESINAGN